MSSKSRPWFRSIALGLGIAMLTLAGSAVAASGDTLVNVASPTGPFSQNKQNEPALAVDASHNNVLAAGSNDEIDEEACNAGADNTCPFTPGVGVSGIYFSFDNGQTWTQPTYRGLTARDCLGQVGNNDPDCTPQVGPIGTLPKYYENGLVSDGDPALAFGPVYKNGSFSWSNGSRLYYANLTSNLSGTTAGTIKGFEGVAVSRLDAPASTGLTPAIVANQNNWKAPVIASKQNAALFSDKEQVWADNASSSPFFGHVYVCSGAFRGGPGASQPLMVSTSTNGGNTWTTKQVTPATNNTSSRNGFGRSGCTIRTDSNGVVYVFAEQFGSGTPSTSYHIMVKSYDGGATWTRPRKLFPVIDPCFVIEPSIGRCVEDGIGGARNDLAASPSVDIANGAPTGADATNEIIDSWVDGRSGLNHEHVMVSYSGDGAQSFTAPRAVESPGDRGYYAAPALSPNGTDAWLVYNAYTTPFRNNTTQTRGLVGVVKHADITAGGRIGTFTEIHRGAVGDPRASSQNGLQAEFLGDYVYAVATRTYGAGVWNDARNAGVCGAINTYRQKLHNYAAGLTTTLPTPPPVEQVCPFNFGNTDIYGGSYADPTP
ncbi:MAG: hypothetical protein QOH48_930 [Actinomycetota bacterium]|nr:hypothetical protein [Actinomycetota bacterium]